MSVNEPMRLYAVWCPEHQVCSKGGRMIAKGKSEHDVRARLFQHLSSATCHADLDLVQARLFADGAEVRSWEVDVAGEYIDGTEETSAAAPPPPEPSPPKTYPRAPATPPKASSSSTPLCREDEQQRRKRQRSSADRHAEMAKVVEEAVAKGVQALAKMQANMDTLGVSFSSLMWVQKTRSFGKNSYHTASNKKLPRCHVWVVFLFQRPVSPRRRARQRSARPPPAPSPCRSGPVRSRSRGRKRRGLGMRSSARRLLCARLPEFRRRLRKRSRRSSGRSSRRWTPLRAFSSAAPRAALVGGKPQGIDLGRRPR